MPYQRKTIDYYILQADYGYGEGFEDLTAEHPNDHNGSVRKAYAAIRAQLKTYRANDPQPARYKIVKRRERRTEEQP